MLNSLRETPRVSFSLATLHAISRLPRHKSAVWLLDCQTVARGAAVALCMNPETRLMRAHKMGDDKMPARIVAAALTAALLTPQGNEPKYLPARLVVASEHYDTVTSLCRGLDIMVETMPEGLFDKLYDQIGGLADNLPDADYLADGRVTLPMLERFFTAAACFGVALKGQRSSYAEAIRLEGLTPEPLPVLVLRDKETLAATIFMSEESFNNFCDGSPDALPDFGDALRLSFETAEELGETLFQQADEHGWRLLDGYMAPLLMRLNNGTRLANHDEIALATRAIEVLAEVVGRTKGKARSRRQPKLKPR